MLVVLERILLSSLMMMIVYWYLFSNHYTLECIHRCEKKERNVAPLKVPGLYMGPLLVVSACISCLPPNLHPLLGFLPSGVRRAVLPFHHTPVGPSVCTEAGCRPALFAPGPACLFPLDYIDNFYIHMALHFTT